VVQNAQTSIYPEKTEWEKQKLKREEVTKKMSCKRRIDGQEKKKIAGENKGQRKGSEGGKRRQKAQRASETDNQQCKRNEKTPQEWGKTNHSKIGQGKMYENLVY